MRDISESWRDRSEHYPLINVDIVVGENNVSIVSLSQQNFIKDNNISDTLWWLPVKTLAQSGNSDLIWLSANKRNASFELENGNGNEWLILNPGTGYYRVEYSADIFHRIIAQLKENHTAIPVAARNYLIGNQCKLANAESIQWNDNVRGALELISYLGNETSWDVWNDKLDDIIRMLKGLNDKDEDEELGSFQRNYLGSLMNSVLEKIGLTPAEGDDENAKLRKKLMTYSETVEIPLCTSYASQLMAEWRRKPEVNPFDVANISDDLREKLYCTAVIADDDISFRFLLERLINGDKDYLGISKALACSKDTRLLSELLQNNTRLANGPEYLKNIYLETIPIEILRRKRRTMRQAVYEFWMGEVVSGGVEPASFIRFCWMLVPSNGVPSTLKEKIIRFLDENKVLFGEFWDIHVPDYKISIHYESPPKYAMNDETSRKKIAEWFSENLI